MGERDDLYKEMDGKITPSRELLLSLFRYLKKNSYNVSLDKGLEWEILNEVSFNELASTFLLEYLSSKVQVYLIKGDTSEGNSRKTHLVLARLPLEAEYSTTLCGINLKARNIEDYALSVESAVRMIPHYRIHWCHKCCSALMRRQMC